MNKLYKLSLVALVFSLVACAQKGNVSQNVKQAFNQKFPDAKNVSWEKENGHEWEAEFKMNGNEYSANFNGNGDWMETESKIENSEVPALVSQSMIDKYSNAKIKEVYKVERKDGISYEYEFKMDGKTQEVLFDSSGNIVKKQNAEEDEEGKEYEEEDDDN